MIIDYDRRPEASVDQKVHSLMESTQLALNDIARAQQSADVAKEDAQTSVALSQTARQAAAAASDAAATAKQAADDATAAVEVIEGDVSGLTTRVAQAEADIDTAEGNITSLTGRVAAAEGEITTIEGNVSSLTGRVADAEADISTAEGNISTLQSDVATAQGNISTIQGNITNLSGRVSDAESDITTVEGNITILSGWVADAEDDVEDVLKGLALAEDVVGTLNWITAHSTVTTDTVPDPDTKYYIKHLDGTFEFVTDTTGKNPAQEGWYVLDEALQNYVLAHLALTNEGLKVMKDGSEWKVLIGDDGVYILDPDNIPANQMTADGNIVGYEDETRVEIDYNSMRLVDAEGKEYVYISDLRERVVVGDEVVYLKSVEEQNLSVLELDDYHRINVTYYLYDIQSVVIGGTDWTNKIVGFGEHAIFVESEDIPSGNANVVYRSNDEDFKAYTFGYRRANGVLGVLSFCEGKNNLASGRFSHAEGNGSEATGHASHAEGAGGLASGYGSHAEGLGSYARSAYGHAEGIYTQAGYAAHAQNYRTIAMKDHQTAIGRYNDNQQDTAFEIGNGNSSRRSNAFTVDWDGNVEFALDTTTASATDYDIYTALQTLGWDSDVIV